MSEQGRASRQTRGALEAALSGDLFSAKSIPADSRDIIENFDRIVDSVRPLSAKQSRALPTQIRALSHLLTDERTSRRLGYMNQAENLAAYARYYEWWNIFRLVRLFCNMEDGVFDVRDGDAALDIGSGPLTAVIALFLARPELRARRISFYCTDISASALAFGEELFRAVSGALNCEAWKIIRVKGPFGTPVKERASLVLCANVFNEAAGSPKSDTRVFSARAAHTLMSYLKEEGERAGAVLIEPGDPHSSRILTSIRARFETRRGEPRFTAVSPCPHDGACPMSGGAGRKWCNFAFGTEDAPPRLKRLSEAASLPKVRAALSFVAFERGARDAARGGGALLCRVASDAIRLPAGRTGYYGCSERGLLLLVPDAPLKSGQLVSIKGASAAFPVDGKSGALIVNIRFAKER